MSRPTAPRRAERVAESHRLGAMLIEHADRVWEAEREVAARYFERSKTIVTFASGLLGGTVVAVALALGRATRLDLDPWAVGVLLALNLVVLGACVFFLLQVPVLLLHSVVFPFAAAMTLRKDLYKKLVELEACESQTEMAAFEPPSRSPSKTDPEAGSTNQRPMGFRAPSASHELLLPVEFLEFASTNADSGMTIVSAQILQASEDLRARNLREKHRIQAGERALVNGLRCVFVAIIVVIAQFSLGLMGT